MPVYNGAHYIEGAVRSLLDQTESDFSLLISDNCSTDETPQICARLGQDDERIRYVRQPSNVGPGRNFEYLLQMAESPFFMWAAHDDLRAPTFLEVCLRLLRQEPEAVACSVGTRVIDELGSEQASILPPAGLSDADPVKRAMSVFQGGAMAIYGLMRRDLVPDSLALPDIRGSDVAFVFTLALRHPIVTTNERLITYRIVDREDKTTAHYSELYEGTRMPTGMFRSMRREGKRGEIGSLAKIRLTFLLGAQELIVKRQVASLRNRLKALDAREEGRWGVLAWRVPVELVLGPSHVIAAIRREISLVRDGRPRG